MPATPTFESVLEAADDGATHREVERLLRMADWTPCGAGDWAVALAAPGADVVARISPFDPVGPYTARLYEEAAATGLTPRLIAHRRLTGGGDLQVMERLRPVPPVQATEFLARLGDGEQRLGGLGAIVRRIHAEALRELPWCGPLDHNPANVMQTRDGRLVLTDPYYADGPDLYATAARDPDAVVAAIPEHLRRYMTEIPLAESGPWDPQVQAAIRENLRLADERARWAGAAHSGAMK